MRTLEKTEKGNSMRKGKMEGPLWVAVKVERGHVSEAPDESLNSMAVVRSSGRTAEP
jgi:hypothetical protein